MTLFAVPLLTAIAGVAASREAERGRPSVDRRRGLAGVLGAILARARIQSPFEGGKEAPMSRNDRKGATMRNLSLATVGAVCALVTVAGFFVGIVLTASGGVQVLIPETGAEGLEWIADVQDAGNLFFAGAWFAVFAGLFGLVAFVGFYDALREAGPVMIIAPVAGAVGLTLVTISHVIPVAMAYELASGYSEANDATQAALGVTFDTLASLSLLTNYFGNALGWGVTVPLYAIAILKTSALPRWIGWLGLVVAVFAGWLGLLAPASDVIEGLTSIGFLGFFVFMASMGIAILRRRKRSAAATVPIGTVGT